MIPIFWLLSHLGLSYTWFAFPVSETITALVGLVLYIRQLRCWNLYTPKHKLKGMSNMKMITAIINRKDSAEVCQALTENGFYFTKTTSFGGFLSSGNVTLTIGVENEKVADALSVIRSHCSCRVENVPTTVPSATPTVSYPTQVSVGGATVFVTNVELFEKM